MKISMKRLGAFIMALVMVFGLLPVINNTVNAVDVTGLTDGTIGVSYTLANNPLAGVAGVTAPEGNALAIVGAGKLVGSNYMACANTVTITNNKSSKAILSFDFELSGTFGTVTIDGTNYTAATTDSFEKELDEGGSITIKITPKRTAKATGGNVLTMSVTNLSLTPVGVGPVTTTFEAPAFGSYTVEYSGNTLTMAAGSASQAVTNEVSVAYTLTAIPGQGYKLAGWYDSASDTYISNATSFVAQFEAASTIRPIIVPENTAVFMVGSVKDGDAYYFDDLNEAVAYAEAEGKTQVTLVQSGILEAADEAYVIPAGMTLLIPMDSDYTATGFDEFGPAPEHTTEVVTPYAYLTLTMGEGAILSVEGTLDIESKHTTAQGSGTARPYGGRPSGAYGAIYMSPEAEINLYDGANLYAWGYVYGEGSVCAYDGSSVYELMQVLDFPGGSNMAAFVDSDLNFDFDNDTNPTNDYIKTFPFSQYYVQNIEVALHLYAGATEYVYLTMTAANVSMGMPVEFIGENGMFCAEDGVISKMYDPSTDRLYVTVNGNASMAGIKLDMTGTAYEASMLEFLGVSKVDAATFILTLNSNITIDIVSGTTTVKQDLSLLPGVEINIYSDATLLVARREFAEGEYDNLTGYGTGGYNIYLWDLENWGKYAFQNQYLIPLSYSPTSGRYTRSYSDLKDVVLNIDGTLITEGFVYSTVTFDEEAWVPLSGGASVISKGRTGKIVLSNGCGLEDVAYCLDGTSSVDHYMYIDSMWLQNGDGSYLLTQCDFCSGVADETVEECQHYGIEYNYCDVHNCWYTEGHGNCVSSVEITWIVNGQAQPMEVVIGQVPVYPTTPSKPANGCTVYTFAGWATSANGEVLASLPAASVDAVYYAIFTESISHVGDNDNNHDCDTCGDPMSTCVDEDQNHICDYVGCQAELSSCTDENQDHFCDYVGCQIVVSICEDDNQDHLCDYVGCQASLSGCADNDLDHFCDWTGCQVTLSSCDDGDQDHLCDYVGCQASLSGCADNDLDHFCDWTGCHVTLSSCDDGDQDHFCDWTGCQAELSNCTDGDADHICDYAGCRGVVTACRDDDQDHICDYDGCQAVMSSCVDDDFDHLCDYAGCQDELSVCTDDDENHICDYSGCQLTVSSCKDDDYDHYCDYFGCRLELSTCRDLNMDHICDYSGCNAGMSDCEDLDEDHFCDYDGCQARMSYCVDDDFDHYCDYSGCEAELTSCEDLDEDHYCDYSGCGEELTSCEDLDDNHYCDYSGCQVEMSSCEDLDEDHTCDYSGCQLGLTSCEDLDEDHYCDYVGCQAELTDCEDLDEDHCCDYAGCGEQISNCFDTDGDGDHECDYAGCNEIISTCYGGEANCVDQAVCEDCFQAYGEVKDHGYSEGWEYVQIDNDQHQVWCKDCYEYSYNDGHDYDDHVCSDCGWTEEMTVQFYNGNDLWTESTTPYGTALGIAGMPVPDAPTGQSFAGWYDAEGNHIVHGMTVTENIVAYATFATNTYTVTWIVDGVTTTETYAYGATPSFSGNTDKAQSGCTVFTFDGWDKDIVAVTGDVTYTAQYTESKNHSWNEADCENAKTCSVCGDTEGDALGHGHTEGFGYTDLENGNHSVTCKDCDTVTIESQPHDYTYDTRNHKCQCGAIEEFKLTVVYGPNGEHIYEAMIPYWTPMADLDGINNIPWNVYVNDATHFGRYYVDDYFWDMDRDGDLDRDRYFTEGYMPARDMYVEVRYDFNGFVHDGNGWKYRKYGSFYKNEMLMLTMADLYENGSDEEIEGIYMVDVNGYRIENGMGRWYYMGEWLNGVTYEPNAEDIAYYEGKGLTFIDKEMTWYYFGEDGKWQYNYTGLVGNSYVVNGQAVWHVGLVEIDGEYYYFKGDEVNGGNIMVTGDYNVSRNNTDLAVVIGGVYTFGADGALCMYDGITNVDGTLRYYENAQLMLGNGLTQVGENYIYVNSYGELIVDAEYYISSNEFGIKNGIYYFDENGFLVIPEAKEGLFFEDGKWYYYVDGAKAYCAGLIEIEGNLVYVKSDGSLATGAYYVTNTNGNADIAAGTKCLFDENGIMQDALNGVVDGYYYVDNSIAYAAGLIETENGYIYVKSNGQIVTNCQYWITNVNDTGVEPGYYSFDENGIMAPALTGVKDGYYYVDGQIAYAAGLVETENGYVYVRSNGQLATGKYWITNVNDTGVEPGYYNFDEEGYMIVE